MGHGAWDMGTTMCALASRDGTTLQVLHLKAAAPTLCRLSKCLCRAAGIVAGCRIGGCMWVSGEFLVVCGGGAGNTQERATSTTSSNYQIH